MRIQDMFERDIDRNINGVIKIEQNDEEVIEQELAEYVVTNELRGHFSTFFDAYERARRPHRQDRRVDLGLLRLR